MALGPKAMGEAIAANLKTKTGKSLSQWQAELTASGTTDAAAARRLLRERGLGQFQAATVAEYTFATDAYADEARLVEEQFARHPQQRELYDLAVASLDPERFTPKPCRSYLPVYRDGRIAVSFKATRRGLYAALNLADPASWPDRVDHKPSLGGSTRLKDGVYLSDSEGVLRLGEEVR